MCDDRERLIGYVYEECDPAERREIEAHVASCDTCRVEIDGLRAVRTDLLAWDVPEHESVWRPFVQPRVTPSWRDIPVWALAAAASLLLVAGLAGGALTELLLHRSHDAGQTASAPPAAVQTAGVSQNDLTELQKRIITMMRSELETRERVQAPAVRTAQVVPVSTGPTDQLAQEIDQIRRSQAEFSRTVSADMNNIMNKINERSVTPISFSGVERR